MAEAELVDTLEDTTEVVRTSIGTWDTETDNVVDINRADSCGTCDLESDIVVYSRVVPTSIRVDTYAARDINFDSEEDIEMILTSIGTDEVDQIENTCEGECDCTPIGLQSSEHVTEL